MEEISKNINNEINSMAEWLRTNKLSLNVKFFTWIKNSLKFVPKGPIDNYPALV